VPGDFVPYDNLMLVCKLTNSCLDFLYGIRRLSGGLVNHRHDSRVPHDSCTVLTWSWQSESRGFGLDVRSEQVVYAVCGLGAAQPSVARELVVVQKGM